ncbi:organic hydroperoxide resistance protein [Chachezhania sediminis]|uniref:organic hydroperoxide resistance protein n=1 Tax=Chachezhania sediminis TaxID=2599291 RepID=UPI00131EC527|nr:organic hydroperoxide resistance protein [Chachezhania sediminis]
MIKPESILYTAEAHVSGGREGTGETSDGNLKVTLTIPKELGGPGGSGTNPEQLFAVGYAACFLSAVKLVGRLSKVAIPDTAAITSKVETGRAGERYALQVELDVSLPGLDQAEAEKIVAEAHERCPYSNATRGNMDVKLTVSV